MPKKSGSILFITVADLELGDTRRLTVARGHQRATSQAALSSAEAQRDAAIAGRDAAFRNPDSASPRNVPSDQVVRQELLGIQGSLKRLVFVLDKSGSMARGRQWNYTRGIVDTWLRYLDIAQCTLIVFAANVSVVTSAGCSFALHWVECSHARDAKNLRCFPRPTARRQNLLPRPHLHRQPARVRGRSRVARSF